ncbi:hypothetical protein L484_009048 [Morus notabilis]|uniref:Uncharacterized protein n=1 Tax=Morus notabilis TaxID=981085 RepID=W9RLH7_9ROSA|nr:hypothetical protein L484_009048 [Morus notabilis]
MHILSLSLSSLLLYFLLGFHKVLTVSPPFSSLESKFGASHGMLVGSLIYGKGQSNMEPRNNSRSFMRSYGDRGLRLEGDMLDVDGSWFVILSFLPEVGIDEQTMELVRQRNEGAAALSWAPKRCPFCPNALIPSDFSEIYPKPSKS